ncbi:MAG: HAD hydrolase-like protein [Patescibacteria group bacterium]|nr:HAD hydrolase-like protein [Patescibacteria group bacterium]MDE1966040.1 HAD hydrolase-like protein [Patescibacteria group bacterium]
MTEHARGVLFDLDGTCVDSLPGIFASMKAAFEAVGQPPPPLETVRRGMGKPLAATFSEYLGPEHQRHVDSVVHHYREHQRSVGQFIGEVYEGIPETIGQLRGAGYRTAIATAKGTSAAQSLIAHHGLLPMFDAVCGVTQHARLDKREALYDALRALSLPAHRAVMVGDTEHDVRAADICGIPCVGVAYGYRSERELRDAGAVAVAKTPRDIVLQVMRVSKAHA